MTTLHHFIARQNDLEGLRELLSRGEDPNSQDGAGRTPLHITMMKNERNPEETDELLLIARELIDFGANVNVSTRSGITPLHIAVGCKNYKMIDLLLESGAQVNAADRKGYTVLHYAASKQRFFGNTIYDPAVEIVRLLLKYNLEIDVRSSNRLTPLMLAIQSNDSLIVNELLEKNASVNLQDVKGNTAMHYALCRSGVNVKIVSELKRHGASFDATNNYGESPISLYYNILQEAPKEEVEKAKFVFKLYHFYTNDFTNHQQKMMLKIDMRKHGLLYHFIKFCMHEIKRMRKDKLSDNFTVHDIAVRGAHSRFLNNSTHLPSDISLKMIYKLLKNEYFIYRDLICAGICYKYMRKTFAGMCCFIETDTIFLNDDSLYELSHYLSNFDMLNMMIACSAGKTRKWYLPRFTHCTRCIVS